MTVTAPPVVALRQFIAGTWEEGSGDFLISSNPAHPREAVAEGQQATPADVDRAVTAAAAATRDWSRTPIHERGAVLLRAADHLAERADSIGLELAREEGKTLTEARAEVTRAAQILRYYGNEGDRSAGEIFSSPRRGERILVTRKPLGVVGVITPFNFPIAIPAWKIAPALVYGNTVVWKPAGTVPLLAIRLAEALHEAGLPAGVLNLLIGPGPIGTVLVEHPLIGGLTFTGSTGVGRRLAATAAAAGVPIQAEMGGKNASIVSGRRRPRPGHRASPLRGVPVHRPKMHRNIPARRGRTRRRRTHRPPPRPARRLGRRRPHRPRRAHGAGHQPDSRRRDPVGNHKGHPAGRDPPQRW